MSKKTVIIMGNGPSLKDVDFEMLRKFDTYGLNSAYRAYERMNWYPKYFGCFDYIVTNSHRDNFRNLVIQYDGHNSVCMDCFESNMRSITSNSIRSSSAL